MPTTSEISRFQREYPAAALWCMDEINRQTELFGREWLAAEDRDWVYGQILNASLRAPHESARMYESLEIPNGDYAVSMDGTDHQFRVWTVQRGQLAGQRIVKHQADGRFRGFAFITRDGNLRIWSRFASQATSEFASAFDRVVTSLVQETFEYVYYTIRRRCPICNEYVPDEERTDEGVTVALCGNHARMRDNATGDGLNSEPDPELELLLEEEEEIERIRESRTSSTRATRSRTPRTLLCENDTGLIR